MWRAGVHRVWGLPNNGHRASIPLISGRLPLYDENCEACALLYAELPIDNLLCDLQIVAYATNLKRGLINGK